MDQSLSQDLRTSASGNEHTSPQHVDYFQQNTSDPGNASPGQNPEADPKGGLGTNCRNAGRSERFKLQSIAKKILKGEKTPDGKPYRIGNCIYAVTDKVAGVDVLMGKSGSAKFNGLQTCNSVWNCRPCQHKITRHREKEIQHAMNGHFAAGGSCLMITWTHGHEKNDKLAVMVQAYKDAKSDMTARRSYKKILSDYQLTGNIRALETTFGWANGWHPHGHDLNFCDVVLTAKQRLRLRRLLFCEWYQVCKKHGLPLPSYKYGVDVAEAWSAAEYMAKFGSDQKWGAGKELTRLNSKKGKGNGERFTPFDLLRAYEKGYKPETMAKLFREYAAAYYRKHQLQWSPKLKQRFGIAELKDEEILELSEEEHAIAGNISYPDWRIVTKQARDLREQLLSTCERHGFDAVQKSIDALPRPAEKPKNTPVVDLGALLNSIAHMQPKAKARAGAVPGSCHGFIPETRPELADELAVLAAAHAEYERRFKETLKAIAMLGQDLDFGLTEEA